MSLRFFLVWFLSATVNLKNIQKLLNFLGGRVGSKAIEVEVEVEVNGKKLKIQSRNQQELLAAIEATKKFVCTETALPAIDQFPEEIFLKVTTKLETVQELETAKFFVEENRNSGLFLSADFYDIEQPLLPAETSPQSSTNLLQQTGRGLRPKLPKSEKTELDATNLYHEPPQNRPQTSSRNIPPVNQPQTQPIDNHEAFLEASSLLLRYPNLECPNQIILNEKFSLFVQLLIEQPKPSTQAIYVENSCTPAQLPEIEVVLRTPRGLDIEGNDYQLMQVKLDSDSSVEFNLTACKLGEQEIRVDFYQCDRRLGTERCIVLVVKEPLDYDVSKPKEVTSLEFKIAPIVPPPDLELCIELRDDRTLYFTLHSKVAGYHHVKVGELTLKGSPLEKMQAVYKELGSLAAPIKSTEQAAAERRLATLGRELWDELIPDKLQQEYWRFKSLISSILITSDEPWVGK
jgi:hypothetical protein